MAALFSENAQVILTHLQANPDALETAPEIAEATGIDVKKVNGIVTMALQKRGLAYREEVEGKDRKVIILTEAGKTVDPKMEKPEAE